MNAAKEARTILARVHREFYRETEYAKAHKAASDELVTRFFALAEEQGLAVFLTEGERRGVSVGKFKSGATIVVGHEGAIQVRLEGHNTVSGTPVIAPIEFDPVAGVLVSTEEDKDVTPTPGERLPRVDPLIVLARMVEKLARAANA